MKAQILKLSGHKSLKDFYAEFPDEESFMKKHGNAFEKAARGTRIKPLRYGDYYDEIDSEVTGTTNAQRYAAMAAQNAGGNNAGEKKGSGLGEMMGMAKTAYSMYQGFGGGSGAGDASSMMSSFGSNAGSSAASGMGSGMGSSIMGMFGKNGVNIPKAQTGIELSQAQFGPQPEGVPDSNISNNYYDNNNPYFMNNPGPKQNNGGDVMPTGPQAISSVDTTKGQTGANAPNAPVNSFSQLPPVENKLKGWGKAAKKIDFLGISGKLIEGIGALKAEKEQKKRAQQQRDVSKLALRAASSTDIDAQRMQTDARTNQRDLQMPVNTGEEFFPIYGNNTNVLAKNGTVLKAQAGASVSGAASGGGTPWGMIGAAGSGIAGQATGNNAGGQVGGTIGGAIGSIWGPAGRAIGQVAGTAIGGLVDTNPKKTKKANDQTEINMRGIASIGMGQGIQNQYQSYVEYGGNIPSYQNGGELSGDALDGQLQTHWGGELETISENPYLPNGGETAMFVGNSHDDGGIGATYAGNSVEAEGGEPVVELPDGDSTSAVVFGNLKINKQNAELLGDKNAKNKKFKSYIADLSKKEAKSMEIYEKSMAEFSEFNPITSTDKLKANTLEIMMKGADMNLKSIADKKQKAADLQSSINETAEEYGLSADHLAMGKYKKDIKNKGKAQYGANLPENEVQIDRNQWYENNNPYFMSNPGNYYKENNPYFMENPGPIQGVNQTNSLPTSNIVQGDTKELDILTQNNKYKPYMDMFNQVLPYFRPSDRENLDSNQLQGEMFALGNNKVEPVYARGYNPTLDVPYDISLQDIRNESTADFRSAQRNMGYNPAAQSNLAAEKYKADQKIGAEEFRLNQAKRDQVFSGNRAMMNDAQLKNLGIYDQQYVRQSQAKSNTKAITQAALNSISDKFSKNRLENRTLQTYENLYNYRFDNNYRAINQNGLATWDTDMKEGPYPEGQSEIERISEMEDKIDDYKKARREARKKVTKAMDGSILKSYKSI